MSQYKRGIYRSYYEGGEKKLYSSGNTCQIVLLCHEFVLRFSFLFLIGSELCHRRNVSAPYDFIKFMFIYTYIVRLGTFRALGNNCRSS
jgi:hypothetical protein